MARILVQFRDSRGVAWEAWEVGAAVAHGEKDEITGEYPAYERTSWLCFYSAAERRRLASYPHKWYKLPADELLALLDRSAPQKVTPRDITGLDRQLGRSA